MAIENMIVALKEAQPALTVRAAQQILRSRDRDVSPKGIWGTWQRYGLSNFAKEQLSGSYDTYLKRIVPPRFTEGLENLIAAKRYGQAAGAVNRLTVFPPNDIILKIPERLLNLRRRVDRLQSEFARIPLKTYIDKARRLRDKLEQSGLNYTSLWVGIAESYALMWAGESREVLRLVSLLNRRTKGMRDPRFHFVLLLLEGQANASLLRLRPAMLCAEKMKVIIRSSNNPYFFMGGLGGLYSLMGHFRESIKWTNGALQGASASYRQQLFVNLAGFLTTAGDYQQALASLRQGKLKEWGFRSRSSIIKACAYLDQGQFSKAMDHAGETLVHAEKEGVRRLLHPATLIQACCHQVAGEQKQAARILEEIIPLLKKNGLLQEYHQRRMISGRAKVSMRLLAVPSLRMIHLLKKAQHSGEIGDYRNALAYARTRKLFGLLMRYVPFCPEPVIKLLREGKKTGLPLAFLRMPIFHVDNPVYHVQLLGPLRVKCSVRPYRRLDLRPKDRALLIRLALNTTRAEKLENLYQNFWRDSEDPARNLSHRLVRLRKILAFPSHRIAMKSGFLRWDLYFTTDHAFFYDRLSRATMYEQVGEWNYAVREYRRAFQLCRGPLFRGLYDPWSENTRRAFLNRLEAAIAGFAKCCGESDQMPLYDRTRAALVARKLLDFGGT